MDRKTHRTLTPQQNWKAQDYKDQNALWCKQEHKGEKQQQQQQQHQQQQTSDWFLHDFISHMNFLLHFLKQKNKWHKRKIKTWFFALFVPNEETKSVCFSTGVQVLHLPSILHHSAFVTYILHFPACPCSSTHTRTHCSSISGDGGIVWRDEEKRKRLLNHTVSLFPRKQVSQSLKIQHQWEKGHFWLFHFCFALNIRFYLTTRFRKKESTWLLP